MVVELTRLEMGNVTGDLRTTIGSAAAAKARRRVVNKVAGTIIAIRMWLDEPQQEVLSP